MAARPPISVVLATTDPVPDLANCLAVLEPQVSALSGEIIVGSSHDRDLDLKHAVDSRCVTVIRMRGASVFELRARAAERACGEIIAVTEDHCVVAPDWCVEILRGFALHPEALGLAGPVLNGSKKHLIDWANYLHTFAGLTPPCDWEHRERCPPNSNVAYRRSVFAGGPLAPGWMELEANPRLFQQGRFAFHEAMTVTHVQSHGFWKTLRAHFDNGRTTTGLGSVPLSGRQFPWNLYRDTLRELGELDRSRGEIRASLPLLFLLSCCHALGEIAGILAGPGRSPTRLR